MEYKIEALQKLLEAIADGAEVVERITITIKPRKLIEEEKQKEEEKK